MVSVLGRRGGHPRQTGPRPVCRLHPSLYRGTEHQLHERVDMPLATGNGISLNYQVKGDRARGTDVKGSGPLVVMIMGTGSPGRVWELHQVPALVAAGYRVCTFDNRGIAPSFEAATGMTIDQLVADTAG